MHASPGGTPRRALGVEASARGLVRGRPRGSLLIRITDHLLVHAVVALVVVDLAFRALVAVRAFLHTVVVSRAGPISIFTLAELTFIAGEFFYSPSPSCFGIRRRRLVPSAMRQRRRRDPSALPTTLVTPGHPAAAGRDEQESATLRRRRTGSGEVFGRLRSLVPSPQQPRQESTLLTR